MSVYIQCVSVYIQDILQPYSCCLSLKFREDRIAVPKWVHKLPITLILMLYQTPHQDLQNNLWLTFGI